VNALVAQIGAEVRMRLRSFATPIAVAAFVAAAFFWIPDPKGNATSLSWELPDGRVQAPVYSAAYVGFAVSVLSGIILAMSGFYLVAGSVRRDRERGVGAILAATPLSKTAYLGGKWAAHFVYLLVIATFGLAAGLVAFIRFGAGPFSPVAFALPYFLSTIPAIAVVAAFAVLFDVTPGLRGRGGLVIWFFVFLFGLVKLPLDLAGEDVDDPSPRPMQMVRQPIFDPTGLATDQYLVRKSLPEAVKGVSSGHVTHSKPFERVPWPGIEVTPGLAASRALNLALSLFPLALAVLVFDRFDPSRSHPKKSGVRSRIFGLFRKPKKPDLTPEVFGSEVPRRRGLTPVSPRPTAAGAVLAEARLIWESASWIKWPLALSAILAGLLPGNLAQGIFLVLLVPVISEAAAREDMAGTRSLVFSQPGVPASPVLWKSAALALVVLMLGMPMTIHGLVESPAKGLACVAGLLGAAAACVGLGSLTSGGKLFTGLYVVVWYMAMSGGPGADFTGALGKAPSLAVSSLYLAGGLAVVALAMGREKLRAARA
jgi:hypothetical protein